MKLESATIAVSLNEGCYALHEENQVRPAPTRRKGTYETQWRRVQQLYVIRDDHLAVYEEDIGPAVPNDEGFNLLGGVVEESGKILIFHTVAEMREWADDERGSLRIASMLREMAPIDLKQGLIDHYEKRVPERAKRSVFGRTYKKQRD